MVVCAAILAIYFLGANHLGCQAVLVRVFVVTVARFDVLDADPQELQVLPLVVEVFLQHFQKGRQEPLWKTLYHVVSLGHKNGPRTLAEVALRLLLLVAIFLDFFVPLLTLLHNDLVRII